MEPVERSEGRPRRAGGIAGGRGYSYQADAIAFVEAHILTHRRLHWIDHSEPDVPVAVAVETGGPGDDFQFTISDGTAVEGQAKHGLDKTKLWDAILPLVRGLEADPSLHGILTVDTTASGTIRNDLREDLQRLAMGRQDNLRSITAELLEKLGQGVIAERDVFRRLRVIVFDLAESGSRSSVEALLATALENPAQAHLAWSILHQDALENLIAKGGRRDATSIARLLGRELQLSARSGDAVVTAERFRIWTHETSKTFAVPGLNVALPVSRAWVQLRVVDDQDKVVPACPNTIEQWLTGYHEWARLADRYEYSRGPSVEQLADFAGCIVVVGGPGAGKTTLLKRLAHRLSGNGRVVLKVRLRVLAQRLRNNERFEDALLAVAADGSGILPAALSPIANSVEYLLADGLDECDPSRSLVAERLTAWAQGHPDCRVIVTTRPVGHDPALVPGWRHVEILPLTKSAIREYARQLFIVLYESQSAEAAGRVLGFEAELGKSPAANLGARNPLLLGFIIQLFMGGVSLGHDRAELFGQVLNLVQRNSPADRNAPEMSAPMVFRFIEVAGWILQHRPVLDKNDFISECGRFLARDMGVTELQAATLAEQSLQFWEDRRLLERLTIEHHEIVTFIHLALGEYSAARFASKLPDNELYDWLTSVRKQPRWRETILLCAGLGAADRVVAVLLALDDPYEPTSTEAILAAACLLESASWDREACARITDHLPDRLGSSVPLIAYETARGVGNLAELFPGEIASLTERLLESSQPWTKLAAWCLRLKCGSSFVDTGRLSSLYEDLLSGTFTRDYSPRLAHDVGLRQWLYGENPAKSVQSIALSEATKLLIERSDAVKAREQFRRILMSEDADGNAKHSIAETLKDDDRYRSLVADWYKSIMNDLPKRMATFLEPDRPADEAILGYVAKAAGEPPTMDSAAADTESTIHLAVLLEAMDFKSCTPGSWGAMANRADEEAVVEVFRGAIVASRQSPASLAIEARAAMERLTQDSRAQLLYFLPDLALDTDWAAARHAGLDPRRLVRALFHPCDAIVRTAAELLAVGAGGNEAGALLKAAIDRAPEYTLHLIKYIAKPVWGDEAIDVVVGRLEKELTPGCGWLFACLPSLPGYMDRGRLSACLMRGIRSEDPYIATGAAEAVANLDFEGNRTIRDAIGEALSFWQTHEEPYPQHGGIVPPSPREDLLRALCKVTTPTIEELASFCSDSRTDVRDAATELLMARVEAPDSLTLLVALIAETKAPAWLITRIATLPGNIAIAVRASLIGLLKSPDFVARLHVVAALAHGWLDLGEAKRLARDALVDVDTRVRDQAVRTLRLLDH